MELFELQQFVDEATGRVSVGEFSRRVFARQDSVLSTATGLQLAGTPADAATLADG
jgi:hypothetical protein